jgi:hypothetical protein
MRVQETNSLSEFFIGLRFLVRLHGNSLGIANGIRLDAARYFQLNPNSV